jgi:hypothetical protein
MLNLGKFFYNNIIYFFINKNYQFFHLLLNYLRSSFFWESLFFTGVNRIENVYLKHIINILK